MFPKAIVMAVSLTTFDNVERQTCEIDSCKWSDLEKSFARGAATDFRPFIDSPEKMANIAYCHLQ